MPAPRFRLRILMIAVALVGIPLGVWRAIESRRAYFRAMADYHRSQIVGTPLIGGPVYGAWKIGPGKSDLLPVTVRDQFRDHWRLRLIDKYSEASHRPWQSIEPDPPEPNWPPDPPAHPITTPRLRTGLRVASVLLGWDVDIGVSGAQEWLYHARCEGMYRRMLAAGDPSTAYCREQAANHADSRHVTARAIFRRWLVQFASPAPPSLKLP